MVSYCDNVIDCRRKLILAHFGEAFDPADCALVAGCECDNCQFAERQKLAQRDLTEDAKAVVESVADFVQRRRNITLNYLVDIFRGMRRYFYFSLYGNMSFVLRGVVLCLGCMALTPVGIRICCVAPQVGIISDGAADFKTRLLGSSPAGAPPTNIHFKSTFISVLTCLTYYSSFLFCKIYQNNGI